MVECNESQFVSIMTSFSGMSSGTSTPSGSHWRIMSPAEVDDVMRNSLAMISHSHVCAIRDAQTSRAAVTSLEGGIRTTASTSTEACTVPDCITTKQTLQHMSTCTQQNTCTDACAVRESKAVTAGKQSMKRDIENNWIATANFENNNGLHSDWKQTVGLVSRERFSNALAQLLTTSENVHSSDNVAQTAIDYGRKLEENIFNSATSRHQYHCMIAEKEAELIREINVKQQPVNDNASIGMSSANQQDDNQAKESVKRKIEIIDLTIDDGENVPSSDKKCRTVVDFTSSASAQNAGVSNDFVSDQRDSFIAGCSYSTSGASIASKPVIPYIHVFPDDGENAISIDKKCRTVVDFTSSASARNADASNDFVSDQRDSYIAGCSYSTSGASIASKPVVSYNQSSTAVHSLPSQPNVICLEFLLRPHNNLVGSLLTCPRGPQCDRYHSIHGLPYQWQWRRTNVNTSTGNAGVPPSQPHQQQTQHSQLKDSVPWSDFGREANIVIERAYCNENFTHCRVTEDGLNNPDPSQTFGPDGRVLTIFSLSFDRMLFAEGLAPPGCSSPENNPWSTMVSGEIRRLEVIDGRGDCTDTSQQSCEYLTTWQWYWFDDFVWHAYESKFMLMDGTSALSTGYVLSESVEFAYRQNPCGMFQFRCLDGSDYIIDFRLALQINRRTRTRRAIRRRPAWQLTGRPRTPVDSEVVSLVLRYPLTWNLTGWRDEDSMSYQLVTVDRHGPTANEFREIEELFCKTMRNVPVKSLRRIQNRRLWEKFVRFRTDANRGRWQPIEVRRLFHGTNKQVFEAICSNGFDWRLCGSSSGTAFGKGSYFARDASYSAGYASTCNRMFVVQVAVGEYAQGNSNTVRPPAKNPLKPFEDFYDSCVDNINNPSIFVTFDQTQSYPEYIIEY